MVESNRQGRWTVVVGLLATVWSMPAWAQVQPPPSASDQPLSHIRLGLNGRPPPTAPSDPYPLGAAGWGAPSGPNRFSVRWVEDWSRLRAAGDAPALKAMPIGSALSLTLSGELRERTELYTNANLRRGDDFGQALFRGIAGADLRMGEHVHFYGEVGAARLAGDDRMAAIPLFKNDVALQQAFVEVRTTIGGTLLGGLFGRQEFADGPRQLIALGDGASLHRTWNGGRLYLHTSRFRLGAFAFDLTELRPGAFDDYATDNERLSGANASVMLAERSAVTESFLDVYYYRLHKDRARWGPFQGRERRSMMALRLWGRRGSITYDVMAVGQDGDHLGRPIRAWGVFGLGNVLLSRTGWQPRLGVHIDIASGGGAFDGTARLRSFNQLYANASHLSEGMLLSATNLAILSPAVIFAPTRRVNVTSELGFIRRLNERDAVYAGLMRRGLSRSISPPCWITDPGRRIRSLSLFFCVWWLFWTDSTRK